MTTETMTESEWMACDDPQKMVAYLHANGFERKLRLFSCAFCRSIWNHLAENPFRIAVEVAERFADGQASRKELAQSKKDSGAALERSGLQGVTGVPQNAKGCAWSSTRTVGSAAMYPLWVFNSESEKGQQLALLRDIFGNPFQQVSFDQSWQTLSVVTTAHSIYDQREFERMPELGEALEAAGCTDSQILEHCRQAEPHVRGCWVLDLVLEKR
ncbi:hypothetical protein [Lignipirellula cremea]|uniref:Uncharacterized protein n=1 Tax=Lignipirellula cremea TaxID=2528010 RepID=A0A518DQI6_9BACT|nr:hypothetical protein [Lignipirellula cremea]QDU94089.1 hypothetical protein Pla8534_18750 [Lignipirellula cremea]